MRLSLHVTNEETEDRSLTVSHLSSQKSQGQFCSQASSLWVHLLLCPSGHGFLWLHLRLGLMQRGPQGCRCSCHQQHLPLLWTGSPWVLQKLQLFSTRPFLPLHFCFVSLPICPSVRVERNAETHKKGKRGEVIDTGSRINIEFHTGRPKHKSTLNSRSPPTST